MKKKAYGFSLTYHTGGTPWAGLVYGEVFTEDGTFLGRWTSSDLRWLESDLSKHAVGYDYSFSKEVPPVIQKAVKEYHEN